MRSSSFLHRTVSRIRLITFDVTNTLIRPNNFVQKYVDALSKYNITVDSTKIRTNFANQFERYSKLWPNYGRGTLKDCQQWWIGLVKDALKDCGAKDGKALEDASDFLYWQFRTGNGWITEPGAHETLHHLKNKGIKLGVISNFDERLEPILREVKLHDYFDFILCSYELAVMKPEEKIFKMALEKAQVKPSEAIHVGDLIDCDYQGARNVGIRGLWYNPSTDKKIGNIVRAEDEIRTLAEVLMFV